MPVLARWNQSGTVAEVVRLPCFPFYRSLVLLLLADVRRESQAIRLLYELPLNRRMNATLEAMARALFKSWFVDFDPVRAKMAGRD